MAFLKIPLKYPVGFLWNQTRSSKSWRTCLCRMRFNWPGKLTRTGWGAVSFKFSAFDESDCIRRILCSSLTSGLSIFFFRTWMSSPKIILWTAWICYDMSQTTQKTTWVSHGTWMCCVQQRKLHQMAPHHPWKVHWSHYQDWHHGSRHRCRQDVTGLKCCGARVGDLPVSIVVGFCANLNYVHYW
jgi:hypothetical protein